MGDRITILFVGDEPSKYNLRPDIAFIGTKSGKKLEQWAEYLDVKYKAINSNDLGYLHDWVRIAETFCQPVVTLGNKAKERVNKICKEKGYVLYGGHLPHPSGRNRLLNSKEYEKNCLDILKKRLYPSNYE